MTVSSTLYLNQTLKTAEVPIAVKANLTINSTIENVDYDSGKADVESGGGSVVIGQVAPANTPRTQVSVICSDKTVSLEATDGVNTVVFKGELIFGGDSIVPLTITNNSVTDVEIEWVVIHEPAPAQ